jgi:leader peptidase (prepilin peptidase)/N-methyltransferase
MVVLLGVFVFCLGCCVGSFINVCVYRLPRGMSLVSPGSHCPSCNEPIAWYDNLPVLSWIQLGGLCRRCGVLISARYPLIELLTGGLFLWIFLAHLRAPAGSVLAHLPALGAYTVLGAALVTASFVDFERMIIPDEISVGGMYVGPVLCAIWPEMVRRDDVVVRWLLGHAGASTSGHLAGLAASVTGMAAGAALIWAAGVLGKALFRKEAMGFGDVKLLGMIGAFVGWQGALLAFFAACLLGAVVGVVLLLWRRDTHIPFGPYLAAGALVVMLHGPGLVRVLGSLLT